ncbi:MAG: redoxin family protein [Bacteroidota bacterium]|nr:redoxin family protein [Bacteroidota bacterium]
MKKTLFILSAIAFVSLISFSTIKDIESITIGSKAPLSNTKMKDVSEKSFSLEELKKEKGLLVIFSCNTCPFVVGNSNMEGWEGRYNQLFTIAEKNNIGMVLINSNEAKRNDADSFSRMKERSKKMDYKANYLVDKNSKLADAFGASTTPHVFLFDADLKLVYKGAIDDAVGSTKDVKSRWLSTAMKNMSTNQPIDPQTTRNSGCSIKRVK